MKNFFSLKGVSSFLAVAFVIFSCIKLQRIDERVSLITRPSKKFGTSQFINTFPYNPDWDVSCPPETIQFVNMLSQQPFYFLGRGFQATAFISQDGDYVIKFFHQARLREKSFGEDPIAFIFRNDNDARNSSRDEVFLSSKMSYEEFPNESGIIYVHLNRTENLIKGIKIHDALGQPYRFQGDETSFIVQKKADYVLPVIKALMQEGKVEEAKQRIDQIFDLLVTLAKKGFVDGDVALMRNNNIGFVKDHAIYIDTGHITKHKDLNVKEQMRFECDVRLAPFYDWLKIRYPELATYFAAKKSEILESFS